MKISLIFISVLQSFWSIEAGLASFHYLAGFSLFWSCVICLGLGIIDFNMYYYLAERFRRLFARWPRVERWLDKTELDLTNSWVKRCYHWRYWGLFLTGFIPHFILPGIAAQRIFRFKYGYWPLLFGNLLKVIAVAYGFKIFDYFIGGPLIFPG